MCIMPRFHHFLQAILQAVFDDNYLHFFGTIPVVDGVMQNNGHYILNFDGTRIQKAFAVLR